MRAQMIRARAGEARNVRDLQSLVVLVPSDGPFWVWNHCSLWPFCLVCMMQLFPLCCCLWGGWCLWVCVAPKWGGVLGPGPKVGS